MFGKQGLDFTVNLLEGDVESCHGPGPVFDVRHEVVLAVIELEVNDLVDLLGAVMPQVVELVKGVRV